MNKENHSRNYLLRTIGVAVAVFSLILGLLIIFVVPSSCSFVSTLGLVILFFLFIAGGIVFLIGQLLSRQKRRLKPV